MEKTAYGAKVMPRQMTILNSNSISILGIPGWMDELGFYVPSTVFQSFRDDGRVNMKGSVQ